MAAIDIKFINVYYLPALFSWLANVYEVWNMQHIIALQFYKQFSVGFNFSVLQAEHMINLPQVSLLPL